MRGECCKNMSYFIRKRHRKKAAAKAFVQDFPGAAANPRQPFSPKEKLRLGGRKFFFTFPLPGAILQNACIRLLSGAPSTLTWSREYRLPCRTTPARHSVRGKFLKGGFFP